MLEIVPDIAQSTHGIRNIFADIRNVPTRPHTVLGMFLLAFSVLTAGSFYVSEFFLYSYMRTVNIVHTIPSEANSPGEGPTH